MSDEQEVQDEPKFVPMPLAIVNKIPARKNARLITGAAGTGKTQALIDEACRLSSTSKSVSVFCATPDAAHALEKRLCAAGCDTVDVLTPRRLCLSILATDDAKRFTGRDARLIDDFEEEFLIADLSTTGIHHKRIRSMVAFFNRSMTELADDDENWLINDEERGLFDLMKENLAFCRGILEPELANLTVNFIRHTGEAHAAHIDHILVDDYQLLSRGSQYLLNLLAKQSITIAANPENTFCVFESHPFPGGVDEFIEVNADAQHDKLTLSHTAPAVVDALNNLGAVAGFEPCGGADGSTDPIEVVAAANPAEEVAAIIELLHNNLKEESADEVIVISPDKTWSGNILRACKQAGIPAEIKAHAQNIRFRYGKTKRSSAARVLTALRLTANPFDAMAWRCWCGFDDALLNSDGFAALRDAAQVRHLALDGMLDWLVDTEAENPSPAAAESLARIKECYERGIRLIEHARNLQGTDLLSYLAQECCGEGFAVPSPVLKLTAQTDAIDESTATALCARANARMVDDIPFMKEGALRICTPSDATGMRALHLYLVGFVNGFMPKRSYFDLTMTSIDDQKKQYRDNACLLRNTIGCTNEHLTVTRFDTIGMVPAEKLDLKIERIFVENGVRVARMSPSIFEELLLSSGR